jgi:anti-sigma regulatory factor (Ser/Thr protein kinase)
MQVTPSAPVLARQALETGGLTTLAPTVELLVSELVTNAVVHGAGDAGLRLSARTACCARSATTGTTCGASA